ncbi:lycopene beta-cyclase CrtY [Sphingomonas sp. ASV193]|uniref:lycopene beta-cyclase CrtY n=1 Tax=Sphingomonas sp. ASV193 TaxID=3144405 RepID=UPI0032E89469
MAAAPPDLIILGGGLAGGLCALALAAKRPEVRVRIVEPGTSIGGNHLWSFFDSDLNRDGHALVDPLVAYRWPAYSVRFPTHRRRIVMPYRTIESERLDAAVRGAEVEVVRGAAIAASPERVTLDDGETLSADAVLDARGLTGPVAGIEGGWQKFVGRSLTVPAGHGVAEPVIMDAAVDQDDGYRFVYLLPFSPTELFVEDTYYHDDPALDVAGIEARLEAYAAAQGWRVSARGRTEQGVLPVLTGGDFDRFWPAEDRVARAGVRGGFFHPLTSYSLPDAVRFAGWLASEAPLDSRLGAASRARAATHWRQGRFDRMLTRLLLRAARPDQRYRVLQRFYRLPEPLIERMYSGRSTAFDKFRTLAGKPPVSIPRALHAIFAA